MLAISEQIEVDSRQVLCRIGYGDGCRPSTRIRSLVKDYVENYHDLVAPSYSYTIKKVQSVEENRVTIEGSVSFESKVISRLLAQCRKVAVFAVTIGNPLEEMVTYLAGEGQILQATVLDAVGSSAAERIAAFVEDRIRTLAAIEGLQASRRFSPGYCDWPVNQQPMVFRALNGDNAGITLTERYLMLPQKSVSGIIGLAEGDIESYNPCLTCRKKKCPGRR